MPQTFDFLVGTFDTPELYTLRFTSPGRLEDREGAGKLEILHRTPAIGSHSWLHLSPPKEDGTRNLYATAWTEPPAVAAYVVKSPTDIQLLGSAQTRSRSGYVTASDIALYSAGGGTGEVFSLDPKTGNIIAPLKSEDAQVKSEHVRVNGVRGGNPSEIQPLQLLSFVDEEGQRDDGSVMDFGGLRHGAHSADLSPDGRALYVADIGRNCIWTFSVDPKTGKLALGEKHISPDPHDGPRHAWPHPNGKIVYCLQEHSFRVDIFSATNHGVNLVHEDGVNIVPAGTGSIGYWADEVRTSLSSGDKPKYLYASTRALNKGDKGYVAVYKLTDEGVIDDSFPPHSTWRIPIRHPTKDSDCGWKPFFRGLQYLWETPTSGGWANAIQPGPTVDGVEYLAMTDSEEGFVFVLGWDGEEFKEVARTKLPNGAGAATAVWL
ncbi:uncharacterized protein PV07_02631 [Cladophialophora immunda]|uniref:Muconate cycloisomerase 1 n=1 Tax=Cladophialophora immunda TaxID=569365 RepID=A0A0D2CLL2_9EURO|nr:uncharacterized protein PV07_02631 [Cladophialophora immunda]KIW30940.1 hypothetical protein PV07_02631 [Cladophialophora immunda]OQV10451.1 hypothetical protein CLAIMM_14446 [Cladophialophora immunda]